MGLTFNPFTGTLDFTGAGGGGGGTIGGSIAATQVAFGSGVDTITGSNALRYVSGTLTFVVPNETTAAISFANANAPTITPTIFLDNDGTFHLFSADFGANLKLNPGNDWTIQGPDLTFDVPLIAYTETGTPGTGTANLAILDGGLGVLDNVFLQGVDGQPGTGDGDQGRHLVTYARQATALKPVSGVSNIINGWFWNGAASVARAIELENKVQTSGTAEFWLEEITEISGFPFLRFYRQNTGDGVITTKKNAAVLNLSAWDTDDNVDRSFAQLTAANTPTFTIAPPTGGTVSIRSNTYLSSDGSTGATGTDGGGSSFKNGLITTVGSGGGGADDLAFYCGQ